MPANWQEYWTFRIVDQETGAAVPGVPVTVREERGASAGHWVSDADGLVRIPKHDRPRLRLRVGLRADDTIDLDARSLPDDPVPLAAPPLSDDDASAAPAQQALTAQQPSSREKPGHLTRFARIGVLAADADVMGAGTSSPLARRERGTGGEDLRYGGLFEIEQHWQSQGFHAGDVLYSLSLGPGDEARIAVSDGRWRRKPDSRDRPVQIVGKMIAAASVGDGLDAVPLEAFVLTDLQAAAAETGHYLAHRTVRAADSLRRRPLGVTELEGGTTAPSGTTLRTVRNMRADGVLTYHFVEPVERFRVVTRTPRLRPAVLVPFRLPDIAAPDVLRRFGHALRRALLDRGLLPDLDRLIAGGDRQTAGLLFAHIDTHLSYYSATIIAAGDALERAQALAKVRDSAGRALTDVIENVVVGRVGNYVAFPLRSVDFAPSEWRALLTSDAARRLRASEETTLTLPIPGVWLRVQLSAAVPEGEIVMDVEDEKRGARNVKRGTGR
jgi:hypothetical protein